MIDVYDLTATPINPLVLPETLWSLMRPYVLREPLLVLRIAEAIHSHVLRVAVRVPDPN